jgi:hypothetical protein
VAEEVAALVAEVVAALVAEAAEGAVIVEGRISLIP